MPTNADFLARFPEFEAVGDNVLTAVRQEAEQRLDADKLGAEYNRAVLLLTAHELALSGQAPGETDVSEAITARHAGITSAKVGDSSFSFSTEDVGEFGGTRYGRDLVRILDRLVGIRYMSC